MVKRILFFSLIAIATLAVSCQQNKNQEVLPDNPTPAELAKMLHEESDSSNDTKINESLKKMSDENNAVFMNEFASVLNEKYGAKKNEVLANLQFLNAEAKKQGLNYAKIIGGKGIPTKLKSEKSSCTGYWYNLTSTQVDPSLANQVSTFYQSARNSTNTDCDYEFAFPVGPQSMAAPLKIAGTSQTARNLIGSGLVNGRQSGQTVYCLVGYGRMLWYYPWSGPNGFRQEFKLRK